MPDELFSVADRVTLLSGASRGIGRALAEGFAKRGARVIITGRQPETLQQTAREISTADVTVQPVVCDVSKPDDIHRLVQTVLDEHGRIDTLLNVAGVNNRKRVETFTVEEYDFILNINLRGAFFLAQEVGRHMIERGGGSLMNIDSLNTYAPLKGVIPYAMSKGGMSIMTRGMAMEWGGSGVRVNAIAPGFTLTALNRKLMSEPAINQWALSNTPLGRMGEPEDMLGAALFLASDASAFMTGQVLYVDGGFSAGLMWPIEI